MMAGNDSKAWLKGAFLLTLAGLISKVLSAGYRIPLQNLTGDIGFYIYQQVYPLLGMALVLSLYGFPSAISKMVADSKANGHAVSFRSFYLPVLTILMTIMGSIAIFLYLNAEQLAVWVGDRALATSYQWVALSLLVIPFTSLLRGVFQGQYQMKPTAYSQIGEQFVRVVLIILAAVYVSETNTNLYAIGEGAAIASICGGFIALLILLLFVKKQDTLSRKTKPVPWNYYVRTILILGLVASLNHMILLLLQFADAFTLIPALEEYGLSKSAAMEAKGVLDRGQPLIQLGAVLGSSFALAMIPSISMKKIKENANAFYEKVRSSLAIGLYLAVGATTGLIAIMPEANILLFQDDRGTMDLRILVLAIVLSALVITMATILQGLGFIKRTAVFILAALGVKWIGNQLLVPFIGITGSALATIISLLSLLLFVSLELKRKLPNLALMRAINWRTLAFATGGMLIYIFFIDLLIPTDLSRFHALLYVVGIASTGACVYLVILLRGRTFTKKEISMLPLARVWIHIYKERN